MLKFLSRLLHREETPAPGSLAQELWVADLAHARKGRFLAAAEEGYSARYAEGVLALELKKPDLFAWTECLLYSYADAVFEGELAFDRDNPHSACGFLFRYQDESDFYSVLVSNEGHIRLDAVLNGSPRALVAWTELPAKPGDSFSLRVIARGSHFTLIVDDLWVAEAVDESFRSGQLAFAGQNYGKGNRAAFSLRSFFVESRPVEVETWYYRWNYYILPDSRARRVLAETFLAMGEYLAAAVQLRKIERRRPLDADELFLKAEASLRLGLQEDAAEALDACLAARPDKREAIEEKANLLYLRGRSLELRDFLATLGSVVAESPRLLDLSGHARFALGDFAGAAGEYRKGADLALRGGEGGQSLLRMNEARAWDQAGRRAEAAEAYLQAARLFFDQEADDDLTLALGRLAALRPRSPELKELRAKTLFRQGKKAEAGKLLEELARKGSQDSAVHYLLGILLAERGDRAGAIASFGRALGLEPDYPLYVFRYAEALFLAGRDCSAQLARALELAPEDGWTRNLAGQVALAGGDLGAARRHLEAARAALPGAPEPAINLAELESREGRLDAALAALAPFSESAACRNAAGNALARAAETTTGTTSAGETAEGREVLLARAAREYERATELAPGVAEYQENLAAAYLELERYSDAEVRIRKALDSGGSGRAFLLAGNLGLVYGDYVRAEAAYRLGLEAAPRDPALLAALGGCYLAERNYAKARDCAARLSALLSTGSSGGEESANRLAERLARDIEEATTERLSCASCGRTWRVPRQLAAQSGASIRAMPPDDSPAGACPSCGKVFCIACRKDSLVDSRFTCPDCGVALKLADNRLRWLVREALKRG
jgi:Flp pilus assembly protein TadD